MRGGLPQSCCFVLWRGPTAAWSAMTFSLLMGLAGPTQAGHSAFSHCHGSLTERGTGGQRSFLLLKAKELRAGAVLAGDGRPSSSVGPRL